MGIKPLNIRSIQFLIESDNNIGILNEARYSPRNRDNMEPDYNNLLIEYIEESKREPKSNLTYHVGNKDTSEARTLQSLLIQKLLGIKTKTSLKRLLNDCQTRSNPWNSCLAQLLKILVLWFTVYLVIAVPFWCTRGLCCCCLCCKFFKPHRTIEDAKQYFITNPPGLLMTEGGNEIIYEPTQRERDSYQEFGHLIRTI